MAKGRDADLRLGGIGGPLPAARKKAHGFFGPQAPCSRCAMPLSPASSRARSCVSRAKARWASPVRTRGKEIRPLVAQGRVPGAAESQFGVRAWCAGQEIRIAHGVGPMDDVPIVQKKPVKQDAPIGAPAADRPGLCAGQCPAPCPGFAPSDSPFGEAPLSWRKDVLALISAFG
ncbi:MAG: hypothetical protein PWP17_398 [Desulfomicrobiaceae bacterium]|jgi:hypothetical protein|nr:hypothetical protein [Desulfomicrobiaceae bacterium]